MPSPEVIAHRGSTANHRENTIPAFLDAVELGAGGVELDVHATADGIVVVHHDAVLQHGDGQRPLSSLSFGAVRHIAPHVPSLRDALAAIDARCNVYVELKARHIEEAVMALLRGREEWCAVHSFDHRGIQRARQLGAGVARGVLMSSYLLDPTAPLRDVAARDLWQHVDMIDEELVAAVRAHGGRVIAWTLNDLDLARRFMAWGVDGLCTDRPREILHLLTRTK
jgi:glycerophosphoryl diester phosphodiesterase